MVIKVLLYYTEKGSSQYQQNWSNSVYKMLSPLLHNFTDPFGGAV